MLRRDLDGVAGAGAGAFLVLSQDLLGGGVALASGDLADHVGLQRRQERPCAAHEHQPLAQHAHVEFAQRRRRRQPLAEGGPLGDPSGPSRLRTDPVASQRIVAHPFITPSWKLPAPPTPGRRNS